MTAFDDRKTAAEAKFTHDQEFQFKTIARRNKLLGLWAAEQMGIFGLAPAPAKRLEAHAQSLKSNGPYRLGRTFTFGGLA